MREMGEREMRYEVELPATPAAISTARQAVSKFAASHGADRQKVALAVSEAVANAVAHAYAGKGAGRVQVRAWAEDDAVRVAVVDQGMGLGSNPRRATGLGLPLMRLVTEALFVASTKLGVEVVMAFERHLRDQGRQPK
jgi:anti-sigma regulatory factor (Ser/Thr protein kinase)